MADGIGCKCLARSEWECCCDNVDWTPQEIIDLRADKEELIRCLRATKYHPIKAWTKWRDDLLAKMKEE
jgi:hypothetical protein